MYLNDLMKAKNIQLQNGKLNLIVAPCGAGKTTWIFETLIKEYQDLNKIVYLCDTNMLEDSIMKDLEEDGLVQIYNPIWRDEIDPFYIFNGGKDATQKIMVMSYEKFGLLSKSTDMTQWLDLIICDEIHNLINYSEIESKSEDESGCQILVKKLPSLLFRSKIVMLTATAYRIKNHELLKHHTVDILGNHKKLLKSYKNKHKTEFAHISNIYNRFKDSGAIKKLGYKIFIYTKHITSAKQIEKEFADMGYNAMAIWSLNNQNNKMSKEQLQLRQYLVDYNKYPDDLDVLVVNGAYETGWNLENKDLPENVQIVICNTSHIDTIIQSRGRVRHDILTLFTKARESNTTDKLEIKLSKKWLNVKLTKTEKDELIKELDIKNSNSRLVGWTTIKKKLIEKGYKVEENQETTGERLRYSIISIVK